MKAFIFLSFTILLLVAACGTFPSRQLTLDFADETTPVMLNEMQSDKTMKTFDFESGFSRYSVTSTYSSGGVTVSSTATSQTDMNKPLKYQLQNTFIQDPEWMLVSSLILNTHDSESIAVSDVKYLLSLQVKVPVKEK
jgi:hypothetical protein